jgi:hypothetical protein
MIQDGKEKGLEVKQKYFPVMVWRRQEAGCDQWEVEERSS